MKTLTHIIAALLIAIACLVLLVTAGQAQTTSSGITISDPFGYTHKKEKWIAKREAKKRRNLGDFIADRWRQDFNELAMFPALVDQMKQDVWAEFGACFNLSGINPAAISITITDIPFNVEGYPPDVFASGVAYFDGRIKVVFWNIRDDIGPQLAAALARGELRNLLWWKLHPNNPREMWGIPNACQ